MAVRPASWHRVSHGGNRRSAAAGVSKGLFPLPLTPFELYMFLDDRPSHPMQFFCRLRFHGEMNRRQFESAVRRALTRHPLLTAVVQRPAEKRYEWVAGDPETVQINWQPRADQQHFVEPAFMDIRREPGVRVESRSGAEQTDLVFAFHHATCDGLAAMDFIVDVLTNYANAEMGADQYRLKRVELDGLPTRGSCGVTRWDWSKWCLRHLPHLRRCYRFYKRRPMPLFDHELETVQPLAAPSLRIHHFSTAESSQLRSAAAQWSTSVNTVFMRDLYLGFNDLRLQSRTACDSDWLRIAAPSNMRNAAARRMSASNIVSIMFDDRRVTELGDPDALLRSIHANMQSMTARRMGLGLLSGLAAMRPFPDTLAKHLRRNRCFASVLFTNLGPALAGCCLPRKQGRFVVGNLTLEDVEVVPLLRSTQLANFAVTTYAGKFVLGMRFDSRLLDAASADEVLSAYVKRIRASLHRPDSMPVPSPTSGRRWPKAG